MGVLEKYSQSLCLNGKTISSQHRFSKGTWVRVRRLPAKAPRERRCDPGLGLVLLRQGQQQGHCRLQRHLLCPRLGRAARGRFFPGQFEVLLSAPWGCRDKAAGLYPAPQSWEADPFGLLWKSQAALCFSRTQSSKSSANCCLPLASPSSQLLCWEHQDGTFGLESLLSWISFRCKRGIAFRHFSGENHHKSCLSIISDLRSVSSVTEEVICLYRTQRCCHGR